ncbi:hypothetical protein GCM10011586_15490 [Silvibacterium dinghuense]|nr:hypothetical protein GCM10011586_15490 [Silvibacterium dinghuense]
MRYAPGGGEVRREKQQSIRATPHTAGAEPGEQERAAYETELSRKALHNFCNASMIFLQSPEHVTTPASKQAATNSPARRVCWETQERRGLRAHGAKDGPRQEMIDAL